MAFPPMGKPMGFHATQNDDAIHALLLVSPAPPLPEGARFRADMGWQMRVSIDERQSEATHAYSSFQKLGSDVANLAWAASVVRRHLEQMGGRDDQG